MEQPRTIYAAILVPIELRQEFNSKKAAKGLTAEQYLKQLMQKEEKITLMNQEQCPHLDVPDTLTGVVCDDCGKENNE